MIYYFLTSYAPRIYDLSALTYQEYTYVGHRVLLNIFTQFNVIYPTLTAYKKNIGKIHGTRAPFPQSTCPELNMTKILTASNVLNFFKWQMSAGDNFS